MSVGAAAAGPPPSSTVEAQERAGGAALRTLAAEDRAPGRRSAGDLPAESLSSAAYLRILVPTTRLEFEADASPDTPVWRHTSLNFRFRPAELQATLPRAREAG